MTDLRFPPHKGGLHITNGPHLCNYETPEQWAVDNEDRQFADWISEDQFAKAMATGSIWTVQWYPDTPGGFFALVGADLDLVLAAAIDHPSCK